MLRGLRVLLRVLDSGLPLPSGLRERLLRVLRSQRHARFGLWPMQLAQRKPQRAARIRARRTPPPRPLNHPRNG